MTKNLRQSLSYKNFRESSHVEMQPLRASPARVYIFNGTALVSILSEKANTRKGNYYYLLFSNWFRVYMSGNYIINT